MTQTVLEIHDLIDQESKNKSVQEMRLITKFPVGKHIRQGDLYMIAVDSIPAAYNKVTESATTQLAPGQTQGSRHIIEGVQNFKIYEKGTPVAEDLDGPLIVSDATFTLTHPEHAHFQLPPGMYQTRYQLDYSTKERVRD